MSQFYLPSADEELKTKIVTFMKERKVPRSALDVPNDELVKVDETVDIS